MHFWKSVRYLAPFYPSIVICCMAGREGGEPCHAPYRAIGEKGARYLTDSAGRLPVPLLAVAMAGLTVRLHCGTATRPT